MNVATIIEIGQIRVDILRQGRGRRIQTAGVLANSLLIWSIRITLEKGPTCIMDQIETMTATILSDDVEVLLIASGQVVGYMGSDPEL